jgi:hypothetical protein
VIGGAAIIRARKIVPMSNWTGKWAVTVLAGAILCYAMRWPHGFYILLAGLALFVISGLQYLRLLKKS